MVNRDEVILTARNLVATGQGLSMANLAKTLGVKAPSLYKHVKDFADLQVAVGVLAKHELLFCLQESVSGRAGPIGVQAIAAAYRSWALKNPALYEYTIKAAKADSEADLAASTALLKVVETAFRAYELSDVDLVHTIRHFRALLHGFATLETTGGFELPISVAQSFTDAIESFIAGLTVKQNRPR